MAMLTAVPVSESVISSKTDVSVASGTHCGLTNWRVAASHEAGNSQDKFPDKRRQRDCRARMTDRSRTGTNAVGRLIAIYEGASEHEWKTRGNALLGALFFLAACKCVQSADLKKKHAACLFVGLKKSWG